jgi:hypothetical protein
MFFKTLLFFPKDIFIFLLRKKKFKKAIHKTEDYKIFFLFFQSLCSLLFLTEKTSERNDAKKIKR